MTSRSQITARELPSLIDRDHEENRTMKVSNIMSVNTHCCAPGDTLDAAARLMWEHDCGAVPVVEGGAVVGMLTDRDACMAAYTRGARLSEIPVGEVMSRELATCGPNDSLEMAERTMRKAQVRRLPVVEGNELVGIVSLNDLALAAERGRGKSGFPSPEEVASTLAVISHHRPEASLEVR